MQQGRAGKNLCIVFTLKDSATKEIFERFPLTESQSHGFFGDVYPLALLGRHFVVPINPDVEFLFVDFGNECSNILLINDQEFNESMKERVKAILDLYDRLYITYHTSSFYRIEQEEFMQTAGAGKRRLGIQQHHSRGSVFEGLKDIARHYNDKTENLYDTGLSKIIKSFRIYIEGAIEIIWTNSKMDLGYDVDFHVSRIKINNKLKPYSVLFDTALAPWSNFTADNYTEEGLNNLFKDLQNEADNYLE